MMSETGIFVLYLAIVDKKQMQYNNHETGITKTERIFIMNDRTDIPGGVWPTMITPYTAEGEIDYVGVEALVEWYIKKGVNGIFAVCQSSEMFYLTEREKLDLVAFLLKISHGRIPVIASGTTQKDLKDQIRYGCQLAELGVDAVVFLRNCMSDDFEGDIRKISDGIGGDTVFGLYECPFPAKRCLTDRELTVMAESGRFAFLKDTVCHLGTIERRAKLIRGSNLKLFNANEATLLPSIEVGYKGYSGVMANFHPDLYGWMLQHCSDERTSKLAKYLTIMALMEARDYPLSAKRYLARYEGLPITDFCRSFKNAYKPCLDSELESLRVCTESLRNWIF